MKTVSSFLPRFGEQGYIHVSTAELCRSILTEAEEQRRFDLLSRIMQQLYDLLASFRNKEDVNKGALRRAVVEMERYERYFFAPLRVTLTEQFRKTERILPQWSRLCLLRRRLAPLIAAINVELTRLLREGIFDESIRYYFLTEHLSEKLLFPEEDERTAESVVRMIQAEETSIIGGNGFTWKSAILLKETSAVVVEQEYAIFKACYGVFPDRQYKVSWLNRHYDVLVWDKVVSHAGLAEERALWFDITAYWNKQMRETAAFS